MTQIADQQRPGPPAPTQLLSGALQTEIRRASSLAFGFPGAHAFNALLSIMFVVVQTLIFSRVLDTRAFAEAIAASAIGMYLLPINQSVARANFVLLRSRTVCGEGSNNLPEAAAAFQASQAFFMIVVVFAPWLIGATSLYEYVWLAFFLVSGTYSNIWYSEMQMAMLATGRAMQFEVFTLARRLLSFLVLGYLFFFRNILWFSVLAGLLAIAFHVQFLRIAGRDSQFFGWPHGLTSTAMRAHLGRLWASLQATFAEWLTLNAPYAVFMARFGIGPGLVTVDAAMKLVRIIVSATRNLCEIVLPRVSRAVFSGQGSQARLEVAGVLALGACAAGLVAAAAYFFQELTFGFLLGPNNTVPAGAGAPIAVAVLSSVLFATAGHLLGHTGRNVAIRALAGVAIGAMAISSALIVFGALSVNGALWALASGLTVIAGTGLLFLIGILRDGQDRSPNISKSTRC
jgi:hypothetical protein